MSVFKIFLTSLLFLPKDREDFGFSLVLGTFHFFRYNIPCSWHTVGRWSGQMTLRLLSDFLERVLLVRLGDGNSSRVTGVTRGRRSSSSFATASGHCNYSGSRWSSLTTRPDYLSFGTRKPGTDTVKPTLILLLTDSVQVNRSRFLLSEKVVVFFSRSSPYLLYPSLFLVNSSLFLLRVLTPFITNCDYLKPIGTGFEIGPFWVNFSFIEVS